jgi:hypothetical protein
MVSGGSSPTSHHSSPLLSLRFREKKREKERKRKKEREKKKGER